MDSTIVILLLCIAVVHIACASQDASSAPSQVPTTVPTTSAPTATDTFEFSFPNSPTFKKQLLYLSKLFQKPWLRDLFEPLTLLLISPQSSGKSRFLSILIGFPISPSGVGATTMLPILYILRDSNLMGGEYCRVNGVNIRLEDVFAYVKDLNDKQNGVPSDKEIEIEISRPGLVNINILDLPGYPNKELDPTLYENVKPMLQKFAQKRNSLIVTIGDGSNPDKNSVNQGYASVDDILSSVRPQWKQEVICIKNYVGDALRKMSTAKQINDYFDKSQSSICQKEFFALLSASSDNAINAETLSIEEHRKMLVDIRDGGERRWFEREMKHIEQEEAKKTNIAGSVRIADSVKQLPIGVEAIGPYLQEIAMSTFANQLPSMKEQLMKELLKYRKYSDAIQSELDSLDPVKAKDLYWEFVGEYVRTLESLIAFKTKYGKTDDKVVDPVRFIMSFEEEYKTAHSGQAYVGTIIPTYEDLVSEVEKIPNPGSTGLPYQIKEAKYYGEAAKSRLIEVIMFIFLQMPLIEMTDEVMINCMVSAEDGVHKLNAEKGLRCLLEPSVRNLSLMVDWIVNHVSWLLKKHNEDAIISVIQNPANARFLTIKERHQHFIDQFDERFQQLVGNQTDRIRRSMVELINDYSVTIDIYEPYWLMSVLAEAEFSPTLLLDPVNNNGGEGLGSGFLSILGKMIGGSSGLTGKSVTEALQHFQSTANKVSHSSPVQVSPILVGEMNNVDTQQVLLTAEQHFYMIKNILARRVKTIIHAQYQYFVNVYLNEFNQACMKFVSSWTIEQIKEIIEQSNQGINKLESEAKQIKENLMELEELKKAIEELERENRISFAKTKSSIENLFNKNNKKSSAQSPNQSTADGDASAKSSTANGASGSESKSSTGPKAADPNNKSEPKAEPKPKPKPKPEPKTESKPEPKTDTKTENKPEPKAEPKTEPKTEPNTEPKTESKPEPHKEQKEL